MKKCIILLLAVCLIGSTGCGNSTETTLNEQTEVAYSETDISENQMIEASIEPVDSVQIQEPEDSNESADDTASEVNDDYLILSSVPDDSDEKETKVFSISEQSFMNSFQALLEDPAYKIWEVIFEDDPYQVAPILIETSQEKDICKKTYKYFISKLHPNDNYFGLIIETSLNGEVSSIGVMTEWYLMDDSINEGVFEVIYNHLFVPLGVLENCKTYEEVNDLCNNITLIPTKYHNPSQEYCHYYLESSNWKATLVAVGETGTVLTILPK